ncbi:GLYR1 family protein [Megaselia abdita]
MEEQQSPAPAGSELKVKDVVWAKMKGFTPWPALIVLPPESIKKQTAGKKSVGSRCVFFFGSKNYAWIEPANLNAFDGPQKENFIKSGKGKGFKDAIEQCEKYILNPTILDGILEPAEELDTDAEFDRIRNGPAATTSENTPTSSSGIDLDDSTNAVASGSKRKRSRSTASTEKKTPVQRGRKSSIPKSNSARKPKAVKAELNADSTTPSRATKRIKRQSTDDLLSNDSITDSDQTHRSRGSQQPLRQSNHNDIQSQQPYVTAGGVGGRFLLNRPVVNREEDPVIDMTPNQSITNRNIEPTPKRIGFLGLGIMGSTIAKNFIISGHKVSVWNRTRDKCVPFEEHGATIKETPSDVCEDSDIIFSCVSGPKECRDLVFGNCGIIDKKDLTDKAYVEMSTIDPDTSNVIANGINARGGRYLEAQIQGSKSEAQAGTLVIIAGGDKSVFDDCQSCFKSISKNTFFLGETGNATKVNLIIQTLAGTCLVGLSECLALADRFAILPSDIMDIISLTTMKSNFLLSKAEMMEKGKYRPEHRVSSMQKDLKLAMEMADSVDQAMPLTASANEVFKQTKRLGYPDHDSSSVYVRSRF